MKKQSSLWKKICSNLVEVDSRGISLNIQRNTDYIYNLLDGNCFQIGYRDDLKGGEFYGRGF